MKELSLVHGRIIDLNFLENLHCLIKNLSEFQGWENNFSSISKHAYEPLICLFYANLLSFHSDEQETLVIGKHILLDCAMFDVIFNTNYSGFTTSSKNQWPLAFDVSFDQAKLFIALENSYSPLYSLGSQIPLLKSM